MRRSGSVLVVVLGLLAILAVVGVAFVTMSALDHAAARSFALQTQMMLAADGAIEYTIHEMVLDVWEWNVDANGNFSFPGKLLSGATNTSGITCEPYDYPVPAPATNTDAWLTAPIVSNTNLAGTNMSFGRNFVTTQKYFGIRFGSALPAGEQGTWPDNLGMPVASPTKNGFWIPELASPFDQYLVCASITVQDHNALINLNAHGNLDTAGWTYSDCRGKGYFISDVDPTQLPGFSNLSDLLSGAAAGPVPGRWGSDGAPLDDCNGAVLLENPGSGDVPFTLDEEFELRNLRGTYFQSRLERFWPDLNATPDNYPQSGTATPYVRRLKATTVSWTAEVRGDGPTSAHITASILGSAWDGHEWSCPKPDLNTAPAQAIYEALRDTKSGLPDGDELKQLAVNVVTFRRRGGTNFAPIAISGKNFYGAQRQPFFTEAACSLSSTDSSDPNNIKRTYAVKLEVYNPWPGDYDGVTTGLSTNGIVVKVRFNPADDGLSTPASRTLPTTMAVDTCAGAGGSLDFTVVCNNNKTIKDAPQDIQLYKGGALLDKISGTDLQNLDNTGHLSRKVFRTSETRGSRDNSQILILYVSDWETGGSPTFGSVTTDASLASSAIPIRFPNCVSDGASDLPVRASAGTDFKAFPRVGDLNQVLRFTPPTPSGSGDPWIVTVSKTTRTNEANVKFDWMKDIGNLADPLAVAAARAANILSVGGPWVDDSDNDGDSADGMVKDSADHGITNTNEAAPPEFRVAGKINLNTATDETLNALGTGVGVGGLKDLVKPLRPIRSPAQILQNSATPTGIEARDEPFTRISNIATVRSDTFSIYGTVAIVDPTLKGPLGQFPTTLVRSRRFWALVDRSPALAFPPFSPNYIRPRILNFQWLD